MDAANGPEAVEATPAQMMQEAHTSSGDAVPAPAKPQKGSSKRQNLDFDSESAFPSLTSSAAPAKSATSAWASGASVKARQTAPMSSETLELDTASISINATAAAPKNPFAKQEVAPTTLGEVIKQLETKHSPVSIQASSSRTTNKTIFLLRAPVDKERLLQKAKSDLLAKIVRKVTEVLPIPSSTRPFIIGTKGRTMKQITDETDCHIQLPPREEGPPATAHTNGDSDEDPLVNITLNGTPPAIAAAKKRILAIVNERTSRGSQRITTIPTTHFPLLRLSKFGFADDADVQINIPSINRRWAASRSVQANGDDVDGPDANPKETAILVTGDRELVAKAVHAIEEAYDQMRRTYTELKITIPKRQHRFLVGQNAEEVSKQTGCIVDVPPAADSSDSVTILGPPMEVAKALQVIMEKAQSQQVDVVDVKAVHKTAANDTNYAVFLTRYLVRRAKLRKLQEDHASSSVQIYIPRESSVKSGNASIEIVGKDANTITTVRKAVFEIVQSLPPSVFATVKIDQLVHRHLIGKRGGKIKALEEKKGVETIFPDDRDEERDEILLVYAGNDKAAAKGTLEEATTELSKLAQEAADITTAIITSIPQKLHGSIIGQGGTTLNAIIGEEKLVNVQFSSKAGSSGPKTNGAAPDADAITIRGPKDEVARVKTEIERLSEEVKHSDVVNSYTVEFDIPQRFVSHVVGKSGAGIAKLREELGVKVDIAEVQTPTTNPNPLSLLDKGKKKKTSTKSVITVKGRKENVEDAKKRILRQVEALADETTLTVPLPADVDRGSIIGKSGTYVQRLESKYNVRINFPKSTPTADDASSETSASVQEGITIRGPKKGAESAKKELIDLIEYEKTNSHSVSFNVPTKALSKIVGRSGATIRELQDETGTSIDVNKTEDAAVASVTIKGSKDAVNSAKKLVQAISKEVEDQVVIEIQAEKSLHQSLIGRGGQNIRNLLIKSGAPSDSQSQGNIVRFPKQGETEDVITIRASKALADKIKKALDDEIASLRDRIVYAVVVPKSSHASIIGRQGAVIESIQKSHNVKVIFPTWKEFTTSGDAVNAKDITAEKDDIIKVMGREEDCKAAAEELTKRASTQKSKNGPTSATESVKTIMIPAHLHQRISQNGRFFRTLPNGVKLDHGNVKPPSQMANAAALKNTQTNGTKPKPAARIDADEADVDEDGEFEWTLAPLSSVVESQSSEIPWNIRSRNAEASKKAEDLVNEALAKAQEDTHHALLKVPQNMMSKIIGRQGSGLQRIRDIGVDVNVEGKSGADEVYLCGTPEKLEEARKFIVSLR